MRRAQASEELGRFGLCIDDLEAAEAFVLGDAQEVNSRGESEGLDISLVEELTEIRKRLEHARWTKVSRYMDNDQFMTTNPIRRKAASSTAYGAVGYDSKCYATIRCLLVSICAIPLCSLCLLGSLSGYTQRGVRYTWGTAKTNFLESGALADDA